MISPKLVPRWILLLLIAGAVVLPITICVILAVSVLLGAMHDEESVRKVLQYVACGVGILWAVDLICMLLVQAVNSLTNGKDGD